VDRCEGTFGAVATWPGTENPVLARSISQKRITAVAVNSTGEWLAFGSAKLGQLLVWEWKSESYVLKQQGAWALVHLGWWLTRQFVGEIFTYILAMIVFFKELLFTKNHF
jgi:hypothetical protein